MFKSLSRILVSSSAIFALCAGCGKQKTAVEPASDEPPKPLVMVTEAGFPPYEYIENGKVVGVDVDICQAIADKLGRPLVVVSTNFDAIVATLLGGGADLAAAGITVTEERKEHCDFSISYATSGITIISLKGAEYKDTASAKGKRIGVQGGTTSDNFCMDEIGEVPQRFETPKQAAEALKAGKVDLIIVDIDLARNIAGGDDSLVISSGLLCMEEFAIAVKKGNAELLASINEALETLLNNGKVYDLLAAHVAHCAGEPPPAPAAPQTDAAATASGETGETAAAQ